MAGLYFTHPHLLWLLAAIVPALAATFLFSRSGMSPAGRWAAMGVRALALAAGVIALAGPTVRSEQRVVARSPVIVLTDESESVAGAGGGGGGGGGGSLRQALLAALDAAAEPPQQFSFAGRAWRQPEPAAERDQTDVARALDEACRAGFADRDDIAGGDAVLITDGRETRGSAREAAARWAARGMRVHVIPVGWRRELPPRLAEVEPPLQAHVGLASSMRVTSVSDAPGPYDVELVDPKGKVVDRRTIATPGRSTAVLRFTPDEPGALAYTVRTSTAAASAGAAGAAPVDSRRMTLAVSGPPRILVADTFPAEVEALSRALGELKLPVDVISPDRWPDDLTPYAAVVISDFSGKELTGSQRDALRRYVEQVGGGLVFAGGANVLASRWKENPLGELLPVRLREPPAKIVRKTSDVAVCFVFDRSGSMGAALPGATGGGGANKLELVKASIIASLRGLPDDATVCAIAFDNNPHLVVPPTPLAQREQIAKLIDEVSLGGGTNVYPAAKLGLEALAQLKGEKYFIVLTDGRTQRPPAEDSWQRLAERARQDGISWTSIAVGRDADQQLLGSLANWARGRYVFCDTADSVPKVFIEQAQAIRRVADKEQEAFAPRPGPEAQDLGAIAAIALPKLEGAVPAEAKPSARTQLIGRDGEPLLASWQFGAGRVVAFCSDAKPGWAKGWMGDAAYPKLWTHIVSSVARSRPKLNGTVRSFRSGSRYRFTFDVREGDGAPADNLDCSASLSVVAPAAADMTPAAATAPTTMAAATQPANVQPTWRRRRAGVYEVDFDLPQDGRTYAAALLLRRDDRQAIQYAPTLFSPASVELAETGIDLQACQEIAFAGDGVCSPDPAAVAETIRARPQRPPVMRERRLAPWFLLAMLLAWPVDVWVRKLL